MLLEMTIKQSKNHENEIENENNLIVTEFDDKIT